VTDAPAEAIVVRGSGRYQDQWHPLVATTARVASILHDAGVVPFVRDDVDDALAELDGMDAGAPRLLVLNIGDGGTQTPSPAARAGLRAHLDAGGAMLVLHSTLTAFADWPEWESMIGGRWVHGHSFHPPQDVCTITPTGHEIAAGAAPFEVLDERYTDLRVSPHARIIATHTPERGGLAAAWTFGDRVVCDALGHDERSYDSPGRVRLLRREIDWLSRPAR
jgi:hypothetical protein